MSSTIQGCLVRIAQALEEQNKEYARVSKLNDIRYEAQQKNNALYDDLMHQIVCSNERMSSMANTIDKQNIVIAEQERAILAHKKGLDARGFSGVVSTDEETGEESGP